MCKTKKRLLTLCLAFLTLIVLPAWSDVPSETEASPNSPGWYAFSPSNDNGPSVISMNDWLDAPAGKHGFLQTAGDRFAFTDGTPVKFWGVNLSFGRQCSPLKKEADFTAERYAKYGINAVRLHKFAGPGWEGIGDPDDGTKLLEDGLDRMDYFCARLSEKGIYYLFSHSFGYKIRPGNRDRILAYDEIQNGLNGNTAGLINFAEDLQDLMIEMVVNLLRHKNPYTGKTYAEDAALMAVELQNEDDIFFFTTSKALDACPSYKKYLTRRFNAWLEAKYLSQDRLIEAWGDSLGEHERLDRRTVEIQANPWFMSDEGLEQAKDRPGYRQRLIDNAAFLHETQNKFYAKFAAAIRATGYQGTIIGSPWQAPTMLPHYYNLKSDYLVGWIDRHNYVINGPSDSLLSHPVTGLLQSGLEQVADRPFGMSEWSYSNSLGYTAEAPALMAVYGLGLQGWDASFQFQSASDQGGFLKVVGKESWETDLPGQIGQYPALARMVMRGDIREGEVISERRVSSRDLAAGRFNFTDKIELKGDEKRYTMFSPSEALAAGRFVVRFTEDQAESFFPDMDLYVTDKVIRSSTGQLTWDYRGQGYFTVNTEGTKAVVGFASGQPLDLDGVKVTLRSPYASLFITALEREASLKTCRSALISAVARIKNSGLIASESSPASVLIEPVAAAIAFSGREIEVVNVLDHDGRRTGRTLPAQDGAFVITGEENAFYFEVLFKSAQ